MSRTSPAGAGGRSKGLILTGMIFAGAMTFIDQIIVSIAEPMIQHDLGLSPSGISGRSTHTCWRWRPRSPSAANKLSQSVFRPI